MENASGNDSLTELPVAVVLDAAAGPFGRVARFAPRAVTPERRL